MKGCRVRGLRGPTNYPYRGPYLPLNEKYKSPLRGTWGVLVGFRVLVLRVSKSFEGFCGAWGLRFRLQGFGVEGSLGGFVVFLSQYCRFRAFTRLFMGRCEISGFSI